MPASHSQDRLNPFRIATIYVVVGGAWLFSTVFFLLGGFPAQEIYRNWHLLCSATGLIISATILYFLTRQHEITLRQSRASLYRTNRALKVRSECNQVLIRASDEKGLMEDICRIIVESEGYCLAWVGMVEQDEQKTIRPVAQWGHEKGYLETIHVSWGENAYGMGPTGTAVRSGKPVVAQHILTDPKWEPWREKALRFGYASSISLPLISDKETFGALVIFGGEPDAFDRHEMILLRGLAEDISYGISTLRMRLDQERRENEQTLLATIVEQEMDGVLTFDRGGRIQYVNPAFERISGYGKNEIVGQAIRSFEKQGPNQAFFDTMVESLFSGEVRTERFINRRKDGTSYDVELRVSPVCSATGIIAFAAVIRDQTNEVRLERQLLRAQKMEAIATLSGGIAHDFNNILASVITNSEMAMDLASENPDIRDHIAIVLKAGFRAKNLVRQILTLSCQSQKERQPVRLEFIAKECLKLLRASLPTTIEIPCHPARDLGLIMADPTQVHQVIMNLCTNAADAMREKGGVLDIRLDNFDPEANGGAIDPHLPAGQYVRLSVGDTGHGMDRKTMERIFDPFFTTKGSGLGTGLGLSVVHGIVRNHGGAISFTSDPGMGTTFHVFFPRIDRGEEIAEEEADASIPRGSERILFLDDEEDLVFSSQKMLERLGYDVVSGTDSLEALSVFRAQPERFDLIITDQTMPHMTGDRLAAEILRLRPDIPIILCTGFGGNSGGALTRKAARAIGIREVVLKPATRSEMAQVIRRVLDGR